MTATPKKQNGAVFPQVISDYPLVEAIAQRVVKTPIIPDDASRSRLEEHASSVYSERYRDYIHLGYEEWKKTYYELLPTGKKSILFVMTDDTKNCDDVANYLEHTYPELAGSVLTIHTKKMVMYQRVIANKIRKSSNASASSHERSMIYRVRTRSSSPS